MPENKSVSELAAMIADKDSETMRMGKRQLWDKVHKVGKPGNDQQKQAVAAELLKVLASGSVAAVKREVMWMLSELSGNECIGAVSSMLADPELRQDAAMVLERLPGEKAVAALQAGLKSAPDDFKNNIIHSLRARGIPTEGPPCPKLNPSKATSVKPVGR